MGLSVHTSHSCTKLVDALTSQLLRDFRNDPDTQRTVIVPNHSMANWLSDQISDRLGICINLKFSYLDSYLSERLLRNPGASAEMLRLIWTLDGWQSMQQQPTSRRISNPTTEVRYAWEFAGVLQQLALHRQDWLKEWEKDKISGPFRESPLPAFWKSIVEAGHDTLHPAIAAMESPSETGDADKEMTVYLFGFWELVPAHWILLERLCSSTSVHVYLSMPSSTYLVDLTKSALQLPLFDESGDELLNPRLKLLSRLVARGRGFQAFLLDQNIDTATLPDQPKTPGSVLHALQNLLIYPESKRSNRPPLQRDDSLQIHSCSNRKRELEVVKARILDALHEHPDWRLEDIHVYAPDIREYSAWIPQVFSKGRPGETLSFAIRESLEPEQIPVFLLLLELLELVESRWERTRVENLLRHEGIQKRYLLSETEVDRVVDWLRQNGIAAGINASDDPGSGLPDPHYSWEYGLERLLLRYATDPETTDTGDWFHSPGSHAETLEKFISFFQDLKTACEDIKSAAREAPAILDAIEKAVQSLLPQSYHDFEQSALKQMFVRLREGCSTASRNEPVSVSEVAFLIRKHLPKLPLPGTLHRKSGIQFNSIHYEEIVPGRMKIVMGLNDGAFPRNETIHSYDPLQSEETRMGDPSRREADLYWLLHSLIWSGERWMATFTGQDEFSNEPIPPASILHSILETVNEVLPDLYPGSSPPLLEITRQPRFSHEPECFSGLPLLGHYDERAFVAASNIVRPTPPVDFLSDSPDLRISVASEESVPGISELIQFFTHPARYFCRHVLKMKIPASAHHFEGEEPLLWTTDHIQDYQLNQYGLKYVALGWNMDKTRTSLIDQNLLPLGFAGIQKIEMLWQTWTRTLEMLRSGYTLGNVDLAFSLADVELGEAVLRLPRWPEPLPRLAIPLAGNLKKKHEIEARIFAYGLQAGTPGCRDARVFIAAKDRSFEAIGGTKSPEILKGLLAIWKANNDRVLPFFPETSHAAFKGKRDVETLEEHSTWVSSGFSKGEQDDPYNKQILPVSRSPFTEAFFEMADQVYGLLESEDDESGGEEAGS